jgi:hypothetical protein
VKRIYTNSAGKEVVVLYNPHGGVGSEFEVDADKLWGVSNG